MDFITTIESGGGDTTKTFSSIAQAHRWVEDLVKYGTLCRWSHRYHINDGRTFPIAGGVIREGRIVLQW